MLGPFGGAFLIPRPLAVVAYCRTSDLCARHGGEEFAILLPETELNEAHKVAERLGAAVRSLMFKQPSGSVHVTVSFGASSMDHDRPQSLEEILEQADQALYAAKRNGRDRVEIYTPLAKASNM
ncbi:MAG: GGDEF domain-containing protein [Deltaproteobacteria bacterium]|nr:GGDEF domain-containing protein [Deltaproteobacteria bacterium]